MAYIRPCHIQYKGTICSLIAWKGKGNPSWRRLSTLSVFHCVKGLLPRLPIHQPMINALHVHTHLPTCNTCTTLHPAQSILFFFIAQMRQATSISCCTAMSALTYTPWRKMDSWSLYRHLRVNFMVASDVGPPRECGWMSRLPRFQPSALAPKTHSEKAIL